MALVGKDNGNLYFNKFAIGRWFDLSRTLPPGLCLQTLYRIFASVNL